MTEIEVKKPGPGPWVKNTPQTARFNAIRLPKCPDGKSQVLHRVMPD